MQKAGLAVIAIIATGGIAGFAGYKAGSGKPASSSGPDATKQLSELETALKDKQALIDAQKTQINDLQLANGQAVVVNIEGEAMKISGGAGPHQREKGDIKGNADDAKLYEAFVAALKKSRGSIENCYRGALKNNTQLQARTITLNIEVNYKTSGNVSSASLNPRVSDAFNSCMDSVSKKWTIPAMPRPVTFAYKQTLTPE